MDGRQRKFVLKGDLDMPGLEAGRFWFARTRQIIVIGLPNDKARHQLQYVIVMSPRRSSWHRLSNGWTAVNYKVWKPSEQDGKYYEGVPDVVWKAQGPAQDTGVEKASKTVICTESTIELTVHSERPCRCVARVCFVAQRIESWRASVKQDRREAAIVSPRHAIRSGKT